MLYIIYFTLLSVCVGKHAEFVIYDKSVNDISYSPIVTHYQQLRCGNSTFWLFSCEYELQPLYKFNRNYMFPRIYNNEFSMNCKIFNYFGTCSLITNKMRIGANIPVGFGSIYLNSVSIIYQYLYNCSGRIHMAAGQFTLNQHIYSENVIYAKIANCGHQKYSESPILNFLKSALNKLTDKVNYKCIVYYS